MRVLTWALGRPDDQVNGNTKLQGENTIQDGRDPFVLPSDGVGSGIDEQAWYNIRREIQPLSQDDLRNCGNAHVVNYCEERGLLAPAIPG